MLCFVPVLRGCVFYVCSFVRLFSPVELLCWIDHVWSSKDCACCACDPGVQLSGVCLCLSMSEVVSSFRSLRAGSQVFALLIFLLCVSLHTMWSCKSLHLTCILPFGILYLSAIRILFVKILLAVCMLVGIVV